MEQFTPWFFPSPRRKQCTDEAARPVAGMLSRAAYQCVKSPFLAPDTGADLRHRLRKMLQVGSQALEIDFRGREALVAKEPLDVLERGLARILQVAGHEMPDGVEAELPDACPLANPSHETFPDGAVVVVGPFSVVPMWHERPWRDLAIQAGGRGRAKGLRSGACPG